MLNNNSLSPLYLAILNNKMECVAFLLQAGAMAFYGQSERQMDRSPVYLAIKSENEYMLKMMFENMDPEMQQTIRNSQGQTPVMFAAKHKYHKALNSLVELNSTQINQEDNEQKTILMHVLQAEPFDRKLANRLVDVWKADIDHIDLKGRSLLIKLVKDKNKHLAEFVMNKGAMIHVLDDDGKDACDYAKDNGLALEMREFFNCSIKKKKADMAALSKKQDTMREKSDVYLNIKKKEVDVRR